MDISGPATDNKNIEGNKFLNKKRKKGKPIIQKTKDFYLNSFVIMEKKCIDASDSCGNGRMVNDGKNLANCKMMVFTVEGVPKLCLFALKERGSELRFDYGFSEPPWRERILLQAGTREEASLAYQSRKLTEVNKTEVEGFVKIAKLSKVYPWKTVRTKVMNESEKWKKSWKEQPTVAIELSKPQEGYDEKQEKADIQEAFLYNEKREEGDTHATFLYNEKREEAVIRAAFLYDEDFAKRPFLEPMRLQYLVKWEELSDITDHGLNLDQVRLLPTPLKWFESKPSYLLFVLMQAQSWVTVIS
ncbi:putative N-lysine methyltransferase SETD8-like [Apostichopus japonicus]|uniref:Putative N-lysine methyltransferase SETD8-like n=1 Tax=Stichopus japonicus TaxID=307972 RepID=A0A2G8LES5_STIJA|nr:putative N-lysine methyltransferase SETD8-like [Apostichopus japonicus]